MNTLQITSNHLQYKRVEQLLVDLVGLICLLGLTIDSNNIFDPIIKSVIKIFHLRGFSTLYTILLCM